MKKQDMKKQYVVIVKVYRGHYSPIEEAKIVTKEELLKLKDIIAVYELGKQVTLNIELV